MRVLYQPTALDTPSDWLETTADRWSTEVARSPFVRSLAALNVQGVTFSGHDHYSLESLGSGGVRVSIWTPSDEVAEVWTLEPLTPDSRIGFALNTRQSLVSYVPPSLVASSPRRELSGGLSIVRSFEDFALPPAEATIDGELVDDDLWIQHCDVRSPCGWREWTEGLDVSELDEDGCVACQRDRDRYLVPDGTRTYFMRDTVADVGAHSGIPGRELSLTAGASETEVSGSVGGNGASIFVFTTPSNEPDQADWGSSLAIDIQFDVTAAGANLVYGPLDLGTANGHIARTNSTHGSDLETFQAGASQSGTGLKLFQFSNDWTSGAQADRFGVLLCAQRATGHGNETLTLRYSSDAFVQGGWPSAAINLTPTSMNAQFNAQDPSVVVGGVVLEPLAATMPFGGQDPSVAAGALSIESLVATLQTTGQDPGVSVGAVSIEPLVGSVEGNGQDAATVAGPIALEPLSHNAQFNGVDAEVALVIVNPSGAGQINGQDPSVVVGGVSVEPLAGSVALSGSDPSIIAGPISVEPLAGALALSGQDPSVVGDLSLESEAASVLYSSVNPVVVGTLTIEPLSASLVGAGQNPSIAVTLVPLSSSLVMTGQDPSLSITLEPEAAAIVFGGTLPSIPGQGGALVVTIGALELAAHDPSLIIGDVFLEPSSAAIVIQGEVSTARFVLNKTTGHAQAFPELADADTIPDDTLRLIAHLDATVTGEQ